MPPTADDPARGATLAAAGLPPDLPFKRILVVGTGAISVALLPVLVSTLVREYRAEVTVALTAAATRLVSSESLSAFSRRPVYGPGWPADASAGPAHTRLAQWAELVVVWPATLDFCARLAHGVTGDLPAAAVAATAAPVVIAPSLGGRAVHGGPWRRVRELLRADGVTLAGPVEGRAVNADTTSDGACVSVPALLHAVAELTPPSQRRPA